MNTPPQTRERIIKKILDSFFEFICNYSRSSIEHPIDGYTYDQLKEMDDKYLELILMDLEEYTPYYIANHPLNHSDADADFEWWTKCPYWTLDEAVALLFGKNPKIVNWESVNKADVRFVPFVAEYKKITELAERCKNFGELSDQTPPSIFVAWSKKMKLEVPSELIEHFETHLVDWESLCKQLTLKNESLREQVGQLNESVKKDELSPKEKRTMMKLILGMAIDKYAYNPLARQNGATGENSSSISSALETRGYKVDSDTIRNILKEAKSKITPDK